MGIYDRVLKELLNKHAVPEKPSISGVYAAGSLIGLDKNDIGRLYQRNTSSNLKLLIRKYWYVFFPVGILVTVVILFLLTGVPPSGPDGIYGRPFPPGVQALYGVTTKKRLKKRIFPF
jgi:hypothetical protein